MASDSGTTWHNHSFKSLLKMYIVFSVHETCYTLHCIPGCRKILLTPGNLLYMYLYLYRLENRGCRGRFGHGGERVSLMCWVPTRWAILQILRLTATLCMVPLPCHVITTQELCGDTLSIFRHGLVYSPQIWVIYAQGSAPSWQQTDQRLTQTDWQAGACGSSRPSSSARKPCNLVSA